MHANLDAHLARCEMDDLKSVTEDAGGHELLAVVAAVHHHGVDHALNNWALQAEKKKQASKWKSERKKGRRVRRNIRRNIHSKKKLPSARASEQKWLEWSLVEKDKANPHSFCPRKKKGERSNKPEPCGSGAWHSGQQCGGQSGRRCP